MSPVPDRTKPERSASASQPADPESPTIDPTTDIEDPSEGNDADLPITMAASVVLTSLPRDAHEALEGAGDLGVEKVTIRLQPGPSAPQLSQRIFKISASKRFETVVKSVRRKLKLKETESVFCYVNSVFAPALDEQVGNLWRCFRTKDELHVTYAVTPAYG